MPKAIISNKIYLDKPDSGFSVIEKALTHRIVPLKPRTYKIGGRTVEQVETILAYTRVGKDILSIPQGRQDLIPSNYEIVDKRVYHDVPFPLCTIPLNEHQQPIYDQVDDSCIINALPGWGKTFTSLWIARKLGQKTLVVTNTVTLRDQWAEEVEILFGMPAGVIGSGKEDVEDHFIVVANIQTLVKVATKYAKEFGTVIIDECHHTPASTFTSALDVFHARYRIGLSGTLLRTDGKHVLFPNSFGSKVLKPPKSNTIDPKVKLLKSGIILKQGVTWVEKMNDLLYDEEYQQFIANVAKSQIGKGHRVLITADRVEFLEKVYNYVGQEDCVLITGSTTSEERKQRLAQVAEDKKHCVVASRQIFSEGMSLNILSCCILGVPTSNAMNLEQLVGRIMRQHPDKLSPEVIDIQFAGHESRKQNDSRLAFYLEKGWEIVMV